MNKEEKEAIEQLRSWRDYIIKNKDKVNKANDIEFYLRTVLNLIQKQEKIIDKMAEYLEDELTIDEFCNKENCYADEYINGHCQKCLNCIKEYFKKVVDEDVKD